MYSRRRQAGDRVRGLAVAVRWPQVPAPVRAMLVVMRNVLVQDRAQVPWPDDQHPVGDLGPGCPCPPFGVSVRPRLRGGIFTTSIPALASTASNAPVN